MSDETNEPGPRERAFDQHVAPLVDQLIAVAREHGIPLFATFALDDGRTCTTSAPIDGDAVGEQLLRRLVLVARHGWRPIGPWQETAIEEALEIGDSLADAIVLEVERSGT